ncbi:hypothetical protein RCL1_003116 [Eukaryota sp. TZLM3-RCL]
MHQPAISLTSPPLAGNSRSSSVLPDFRQPPFISPPFADDVFGNEEAFVAQEHQDTDDDEVPAVSDGFSLVETPDFPQAMKFAFEFRLYKKGKKFAESVETIFHNDSDQCTYDHFSSFVSNMFRTQLLRNKLQPHSFWSPILFYKKPNSKNFKLLSQSAFESIKRDQTNTVYELQVRYDQEASAYDSFIKEQQETSRRSVDWQSLKDSFKNSLLAQEKYWQLWAEAISKGVATYDEPPITISKYFTKNRTLSFGPSTWSYLQDLTSFASSRLEQIEREVSDYRRSLLSRFFAEQEEFMASHFGVARNDAILTPAIRNNFRKCPNAEDSFHQNLQ